MRGVIEPACDHRGRLIKIDCDFVRDSIQRIEMSDVVFTPRTRGTACILDRLDSVTGAIACAANFFYFNVQLGGHRAVVDHNEMVSQECLDLFLCFEDCCRVTKCWGLSIVMVTSKFFCITHD
jgi:hypothetical protein